MLQVPTYILLTAIQYPYTQTDNVAFQIFIQILSSTQKSTMKLFFAILDNETKPLLHPHKVYAIDSLGGGGGSKCSIPPAVHGNDTQQLHHAIL